MSGQLVNQFRDVCGGYETLLKRIEEWQDELVLGAERAQKRLEKRSDLA